MALVENLTSPRTGNPVANQFVISSSEGQYFQSYQTVIAFVPANGDTPILSDAWDCSATTLKYLKQFLDTTESKAEIAQRIKEGSYILQDELDLEAQGMGIKL